MHRCLSSHDYGLLVLAAWKAQFCGISLPEVMDVETRFLGGYTIFTKSRIYRGSRGGHRGGGHLTHYPPAWTIPVSEALAVSTMVEEVGAMGN